MARFAIAIIVLVVGAASSIAYLHFIYFPDLFRDLTYNPKLHDPELIETTTIRIVEGASLEANPEFMVPQVVTVVIGKNNRVQWINEDSIPHNIASDSDYRDPISGLFDSRDGPADEGGAFVMPQDTYEFTFTEPGVYHYHHEPHPWVTGTIIVEEQVVTPEI